MPAVEGHVALVASTGLLLPISAATVLGAKQLDTSNNPILWRFAARGFGGPVLGLTGVAAERFRWPQAVVTGVPKSACVESLRPLRYSPDAYMDRVGSIVNIT